MYTCGIGISVDIIGREMEAESIPEKMVQQGSPCELDVVMWLVCVVPADKFNPAEKNGVQIPYGLSRHAYVAPALTWRRRTVCGTSPMHSSERR